MPTSDFNNIGTIITEVQKINPHLTIELGIGFGKYGTLLREALDCNTGCFAKDTWVHKIMGVEGFEQYRNPAWEMYNNVIVCDFTEKYECVTGFDLVLMVDSLEHVGKGTGKYLLSYLVENNKNVIVSVPKGTCPQGAVYGNQFERHLSEWTWDDFCSVQPSGAVSNTLKCLSTPNDPSYIVRYQKL